MSNWIPIRIADMAVAACEKEIQKLREENARLRKAGDAMESEGDGMQHDLTWEPLGWHKAVKDWNAAKEGKQP